MTPPQEPIGLSVSRTAKTLSRSLDDALAAQGSSLAGWLVLSSLAGELHRSQRAIAAEVGVEGPTLTHHLNRMEAAGLVTRTRDPENRRAHHVELTAAGRDRFESLLHVVQRFDEQLRTGFSPKDLTTLRTLLQRLADNTAGNQPTQEAMP